MMFNWRKIPLLAILIILAAFIPVRPIPAAGAASIPDGFRLVLKDSGVLLYQKDYPKGNPDFVQVVDFNQGASLQVYYGQIAEPGEGQGVYGGDDPRIQPQTLRTYWQKFNSANTRAFCITNGQFFNMPETPTRLAFPLKVDGRIVSDGYGIDDHAGHQLMLEIWPDRVNIAELTPESLHASTAPDIIGGLDEEANKRAKKFVGRTFTGVDDRDGDGRDETLLIFSTLTARQTDAAEVLRGFGADKVMMLDGGGSTGLICEGKDYVASDRFIPQAVGIAAGPAEPHGLQRVISTPPPRPVLQARASAYSETSKTSFNSIQKASFKNLVPSGGR